MFKATAINVRLPLMYDSSRWHEVLLRTGLLKWYLMTNVYFYNGYVISLNRGKVEDEITCNKFLKAQWLEKFLLPSHRITSPQKPRVNINVCIVPFCRTIHYPIRRQIEVSLVHIFDHVLDEVAVLITKRSLNIRPGNISDITSEQKVKDYGSEKHD